MADFNDAIETVLMHEGGFVNDPNDPGGATNFGISIRFLKSLKENDIEYLKNAGVLVPSSITVDFIRTLSQFNAETIYEIFFWNKNGYSKINDIDVATKVFDISVNTGSLYSNRCIQYAVRSVTGKELSYDGILGAESINAINSCEPKSLLCALKSEVAGYYRSLVAIVPSRKIYLNGWLNRAYSNRVV